MGERVSRQLKARSHGHTCSGNSEFPTALSQGLRADEDTPGWPLSRFYCSASAQASGCQFSLAPWSIDLSTAVPTSCPPSPHFLFTLSPHLYTMSPHPATVYPHLSSLHSVYLLYIHTHNNPYIHIHTHPYSMCPKSHPYSSHHSASLSLVTLSSMYLHPPCPVSPAPSTP